VVVGRLIALNKCPGVHPIGIGEDAGSEVTVHAIPSIFSDSTTKAILLVDASNAFNCLNCKMVLHNTRFLCPLPY